MAVLGCAVVIGPGTAKRSSWPRAGYVVIEPEFRGSTGYGAKHTKASHKQWGLAMQDDLIDALDWAIAQGHVDKDRVCIMGGATVAMPPL